MYKGCRNFVFFSRLQIPRSFVWQKYCEATLLASLISSDWSRWQAYKINCVPFGIACKSQEYVFTFVLLLCSSIGHGQWALLQCWRRQKTRIKTGSTTTCKSALHYSHFVVSISRTSQNCFKIRDQHSNQSWHFGFLNKIFWQNIIVGLIIINNVINFQ